MDIVREILLQLEASETDPLDWVTIEIPGVEADLIANNVMILAKAGLIEATDNWGTTGRRFPQEAASANRSVYR